MRTATARVALAALVAAGCGDEPSGPPPGTPRIDYIDGAIEPVLVRGQALVIEGFGFGAAPGSVRFPRAGGGEVVAAVADSTRWTD